MSTPIRFSDWIKDNVQEVTFVSPTDKVVLVSDVPTTKSIGRSELSQSVLKTVLSNAGDLITLSGGDAVAVTRTSLANDTAFTSKYVDVAGDTMTGPLALPDPSTSPPTLDTHATAKKYVEDQIGLSSPVGTIVDYIGTVAPTNWLLLDGSTVNDGQTLYPSLWAILPASMKSGSNIVLPDTRGRVTVGLNTGDAAFDTIGETGGAKTHTLTTGELPSHSHTINHDHTASQASHSHTVDAHLHSINHNHTASQPAHSHTVNSHSHTINHNHGASQLPHSHTVNSHTHSGTTGGPSPTSTATANIAHNHGWSDPNESYVSRLGYYTTGGTSFRVPTVDQVGVGGGVQMRWSYSTGSSFNLPNHSHSLNSHEHGFSTGPSTPGTNEQTPTVTVNTHSGSSGDTSPGTNSQTPVITVNTHSGSSGNASPGTDSQTPVITVNTHSGSSGNTGSGSAHNNLQPYIAFAKIIKAA